MATLQGTVKFFDVGRNYGFLRLLDGDTVVGEYFFSGNDVTGDLPERGDLVTFLLDDPPSRAHRRELIAVEVEKRVRNEPMLFAPEVFEKDLAAECEEARAHAV